jgi:hypothetical protein
MNYPNQAPPQNKQQDPCGNTCPVDPPQISEQLCILEREIQDNSKIIATLAQRLESAMIPRCGEEGCGKSPEVMLVPMADRIRSAFKDERANNIELRRILDSIQL